MNKKHYLYKINKSLIELKVVVKDEKVHSEIRCWIYYKPGRGLSTFGRYGKDSL